MSAVSTPVIALLAQIEPATQPISIQTALLIVLCIGIVLAAKSLVDLHRRVDALAAQLRPRPVAAPAPVAPLSPEILAVISAAVYDSLGADYQIVSISAAGQGATWSMEGRRQIFSSRKVR